MRQLALHEYWYVKLARAEKLKPHPPAEMKPGQVKVTPFTWICPVGGCRRYAHTYVDGDPPPICEGGLKHSFSTTKVSRDR